MDLLVLILALAALAEGLVEYFLSPWLKLLPAMLAAEAPKYVAAAVGILLAVCYQADLLAVFGYEAIDPRVGVLLTGILLGRGSNFIHDFVKTYFPEARPSN